MFGARSHRLNSAGTFRLAATRAFLLGVPVFLLAGAVGRSTGASFWILSCATVCQAVLCLLSLLPKYLRISASPTYILHYLLALAWFWIGAGREQHWYPYVAQAVLLVIPLCIFARQTLHSTGAATQRRAEFLAETLASKDKWPFDLAECRAWPELKAFREALYLDATPALKLLESPRHEVQFAALVALEFHKNWRAGQAEKILKAAVDTDDEDVRAAAVLAVANVEDRYLVESVANYLADPSAKVRRAASEALLWDLENRWGWIRHAVRKALGNPHATNDSVDVFAYLSLPNAAVDDLIAWTAEKGLLSQRAASVLAGYYGKRLDVDSEGKLCKKLCKAVAQMKLAPALRFELARVLCARQQLTQAAAETLLDGANPVPLRLVAAESLLQQGQGDLARATLLDLARIPNRELALSTARVVQRYMGIDLGLMLSEPLPALNTRQAQDAVIRLIRWAQEQVTAETYTAATIR
jgi:HEAT repeat protein